ncbi:MAG TPA: hypothetical protein VK694_00490 [Verrucomicrobiae bacterium]|nr:hypothetical protein [Verrucomicrobiae bacterium]
MTEQTGELQQQPDGERWLELIGYGHLKGQPTGFELDGQPILAEEFDKLCGDHARPIFAGLETLDREDPRYERFRGVARKAFQSYFGPVEAEE